MPHDLHDFMRSVTDSIDFEYHRIQQRVNEDTGTAGDQGEENWARVLKSWLPASFHIRTKGRIINHAGEAGRQIDILVLRPEYPPELLDTKLYLSGGVIAAFECKITLKSKHIKDFMETSAQIKGRLEERKGTPYKDFYSPIVYGLLAHSFNWSETKTPEQLITRYIEKTDKEVIIHPRFMPDIICIADLATWSAEKTVFNPPPKDWQDRFNATGIDLRRPYTVYERYFKHENQIPTFTPIGTMLSNLLNRIAWEYPSLRPFAEHFRIIGIQGNGQGSGRPWEFDIFSADIRDKVKSGLCFENDTWSEWRRSFF